LREDLLAIGPALSLVEGGLRPHGSRGARPEQQDHRDRGEDDSRRRVESSIVWRDTERAEETGFTRRNGI